MASTRKILGATVLGVVGYLAWKKGLLGGSQGMLAQANAAQAIAAGGELDACGNAPASAYIAASHGVATAAGASTMPNLTNAHMAAQIGGAAAQVVGTINPIAGAVVGAGTAIAATLFSVFASKPPDPVVRLLIAEMPYAWSEHSNIPPNVSIYALDMCGYLHEVQRGLAASGYIDREVVAVDWKVFGMLPKGTPIASAQELERNRMPRPADGQVLRGMLGNDIRFYLGQDPTLHGPWEGNANVVPTPGSPAEWAVIAGDYIPTKTSSPGEF